MSSAQDSTAAREGAHVSWGDNTFREFSRASTMSQQTDCNGDLQTLESRFPEQHRPEELKTMIQNEVRKPKYKHSLLQLRGEVDDPTSIGKSTVAADV